MSESLPSSPKVKSQKSVPRGAADISSSLPPTTASSTLTLANFVVPCATKSQKPSHLHCRFIQICLRDSFHRLFFLPSPLQPSPPSPPPVPPLPPSPPAARNPLLKLLGVGVGNNVFRLFLTLTFDFIFEQKSLNMSRRLSSCIPQSSSAPSHRTLLTLVYF